MKLIIREANTIANVTEVRTKVVELADFTMAADRIAASLATAAGQVAVSTANATWSVIATPGSTGLVLTSDLNEAKKAKWAANVVGGKAMLTNKSGTNLAKGACVIIDTANDAAFKTTTSASDMKVLGVLAEAINNDASGQVTLIGLEEDILVQGNVTRGNYLVTSTTAGRAADGGSSTSAAAFGQALTGYAGGGAGTIKALIFRPVPPAVASATETSQGIVELATSAETITGTDNTRAVHPAGLQAKTASETALGIVELATSSEITTGTDTTRVMCPDQFAASDFGTRIIEVPILGKDAALATGDWASGVTFTVPAKLDGWELVEAEGSLTGTQSSSGSVTVQIANITDTVDMLSSLITISASAWRGTGTVNGSYKQLQTGDRIRFDIDTAGTGSKGLTVTMVVRKP